MNKLQFTLLSLLTVSPAFAQPRIDLSQLYDCGNTPSDMFFDVYAAANGDYLLCGTSNQHHWVLRLDPDGNRRWSFEDHEGTRLYSIIETDNGDIVTTGSMNGFGAIRLSADGNFIWERGRGTGHGESIIELKEGGFVIGGRSAGNDQNSARIDRITGDGDLLWSRLYGGGDNYRGIMALRETDGGIVAAGNSVHGGVGSGWVKKVGFEGEDIWSSELSYQGHSTAFDGLISLPAGGFALCGNILGRNVLYKISGDGEEVFSTSLYQQEGNSTCWSLSRLSDGGFVFVGELHNNIQNDPFVLRTGSEGQMIWYNKFTDFIMRPNEPNQLQEVITLNNDVIVAAGSLYNTDGGRQADGWIVRTEPDNATPIIFYRSPHDSLQTILMGDAIQFIVRARDRDRNELSYHWVPEDEQANNDTTVILSFNEVGIDTVHCRVSHGDWATETGWIITVRDLFIQSHTPDTLNLAVKRGHSVDFALDSVRAVRGDSVNYAWTVTNLNDQQREDAGAEPRATIRFDHTGNFAVEGLAYRGEARDRVTWTVAVRSAILDYRPSSLSLTVPPDTVVNFGIIPFNADSGAVHYEWRFAQDALGLDTSEVALNFGEVGNYEVGVVVRDSTEADTLVWRVNVRQPDATPPYPPLQAGGESLAISPNPFNSSTTVRFNVPGNGQAGTLILLTLHDITGRRIATLAEGQYSAGQHSVSLSGALTHSRTYALPAGVYLLRLETAGKVTVAKAVVVR